MKTVIFKENAPANSAERLRDILCAGPAVIGLDPCNDIFSVFENLRAGHPPDADIVRNISFFMLKEFALPGNILCGRFVELLAEMGADPAKIFIPCEDNTGSFDDMILSAGGIDHAVIGLRTDSGLLFNEVGALFSRNTKKQKPTRGMIAYLNSENPEYTVPEYAYTCGIKTVTDSKEISVFAFGEEKSEAVYKTLYSRTDSFNPAAFLQVPANVTIYLDEESASKH